MASLKDEELEDHCFCCKNEITTVTRRYFGKLFCAYCYKVNFPKKTCKICNQEKRIFMHEEQCQSCLTDQMSCIRCKKKKVKIGKILSEGIICNSCSKYYRPLKICSECGGKRRDVHIYSLFDKNKPYCSRCVRHKFHQKCSICRNITLIFICGLDKKLFCKRCFSNVKTCKECHIPIPAGKWTNYCKDCSQKILFDKRKEEYAGCLDPIIADLFNKLSEYIRENRGEGNAARALMLLRPIFTTINNHFLISRVFPSLNLISFDIKRSEVKHKRLILSYFTVLLCQDSTEFFIKEQISKQILQIKSDNYYYECFISYTKKIMKKATLLHSKRLAITSAVILLNFINKLKVELEQQHIDQFCWLYWGQRASVTGFITHLNQYFDLSLKIKKQEYFQFELKRESTARIEQQILDILSNSKICNKNFLLRKVFTYMHNVEFPKDLERLDLFKIITIKDKIRLKNIEFYLPPLAN